MAGFSLEELLLMKLNMPMLSRGSFWGFDLYTFLAHDDEIAFFAVSDRLAGRGLRVGVYDGDFVHHGSADIHLPLRPLR